jgi:hypothetical protein
VATLVRQQQFRVCVLRDQYIEDRSMHLGIANEDQTAFRRAKSAILQWWFNMALEEFIQSYRKKVSLP